jgi:septum formation protein
MVMSIYLASRSPRRAEILQQMAVQFTVLPADIDESVQLHESPSQYVMRLATEKAQACLANIHSQHQPIKPVLASDTTVCVGSEILGKPESADDAYRMLKLMSGAWHEVHTAVALAHQGQIDTIISTTRVAMTHLSDAQIHAYIATKEPFDKAGAYGIQGYASIWIKRIEGSYSGVMGLPLYETAQLLKAVGYFAD